MQNEKKIGRISFGFQKIITLKRKIISVVSYKFFLRTVDHSNDKMQTIEIDELFWGDWLNKMLRLGQGKTILLSQTYH